MGARAANGTQLNGTSLVTVLFTDIVSSTALRERLGDEAADDLRRAHDRVVADAVEAGDGSVVKGLGDGAMAAFGGVSDAVQAAVAIQQGVDKLNRRQAVPTPLELRVGLSVGEVVWEDEDCFGAAVIEAARLCNAAGGGQILAADLVRVLAGGRLGTLFTSAGEYELKGLARPLEAVEVAWRSDAEELTVALPAALQHGEQLPLVGRFSELALLLKVWKRAAAGEQRNGHGSGRVVMISGEPGVGKTRLVSELASMAHGNGGLVLFGRCDEETSVAYQPFMEALEEFAKVYPDEELRGLIGPLGGELAWLVPSLPSRVPELDAPLQAGPETERYRLFESVVDLFAAVSSISPTLLILDDTHWADSSTLLMLRHLVRSNEPMRLLVVCTYRDTDLGRGHRLTDLLADLRRAGHSSRIPLSGLDTEGVVDMVSAAADQELTARQRRFAHELQAETGGNAFFVREVLLHLVETGSLVREAGRWIADRSQGRPSIPEGVREVVGQRVSRLPASGEDVMAAAAVIGSHFDLRLLAAVVDGGMPVVVAVVEAAEAARLIVADPGQPGRYRFAHGLVRSTIYGALATSRRRWLHRDVGLALERLRDTEDRAGELAVHFGESAALGEADRAVEYARRAGDQAARVLAFERAAAHYERALHALDYAADAEPPLACDLQLAMAEALSRAGDGLSGPAAFAAADRARALGDTPRLAQAALQFVRFGPVGPIIDDDELALLEEALARLDPSDSPERARLLAGLGVALARSGPRGAQLSRQAVDMARRLGKPDVLTRVLASHHAAIAGPDAGGEWLVVARELVRLGGDLGSPEATVVGHMCSYISLVEIGDIDTADGELDAADRIARELRQPVFGLHILRLRTAQAVLAGRIHEAEQLSLATRKHGRDCNIQLPMVEAMYAGQQHLILDHRGQVGELEPTIAALVEERPDWPLLRIVQARVMCADGRVEQARTKLSRLLAGLGDLPRDDFWFEAMMHLATVAFTLGDADAAQRCQAGLAPFSGRNTFTGMGSFGPVDRALGLLATARGCYQEAERYFAAAVELCTTMRAPGWATHTRQNWAEMLRRRAEPADVDRAHELASRVVEDAERLSMPGVVAQATELLDALGR